MRLFFALSHPRGRFLATTAAATMLLRVAALFTVSLVVTNLSVANAHAGLVAPGFRGGADTTYQEWLGFTNPAGGPNDPTFGNSNPNGTAQLFQTTPGAFLTSGGNIYHAGAPSTFVVNVPDFNQGSGFFTTAVLQIRILGTNIDLNSVRFNGLAFDRSELMNETPLGGFGGTQRDWWFEWNNVAGNLDMNVFHFNAASSHMSLNRVAIDTAFSAVPEPTSGLLLVGAVATGLLRRRR
jgi:hypothetical protein